jgi:diaminohydroxyphosphoribosylaminopyrimidine deaminase / 5-amino-6-(5-phosphoribosylamino)uracil reductase
MKLSHGNEFYMRRCLELASYAMGNTFPNPLVGSVIVHNNRIIGEGWHQHAGEAHAEIMALESVQDKSLLPESIIYVNLEPCAHHGRTPSCATRLVKERVKKVVFGMADPNEKVNGKGAEILRDAGIEVEQGVLDKECKFLNRRFVTNMTRNRPYIILKWAQSVDGFIDKKGRKEGSGPLWISNELSRQLVHKWRTEEAAVLVGYRTALIDNPELTARLYAGRNPIRLVNDPRQELPDSLQIFNEKAPSLRLQLTERNIDEAISTLWVDHEISSIIVEGGKSTLELFIHAGLWDEARIFTGQIVLKEGLTAPTVNKRNYLRKMDVNGDQLEIVMRSDR